MLPQYGVFAHLSIYSMLENNKMVEMSVKQNTWFQCF